MKHLAPLVYRLLLEEPQSGYSLVKEIEARTGWKPSWGSIYPLLETLETRAIVQATPVGRTKQYALTTTGRQTAQEQLSQSTALFKEIIERMKILDALLEEDLSIPIAFLNELQTGNNPYLPIAKESERMNQEFYRLWKEDKVAPHAKDINAILKQATKELKAL